MGDLAVAAVGWIGAGLLLGAYALVSTHRLAGSSATFQLMNLAGAVGLAANSAVNGAWPSVALNLVWIAVGLIALARRPGPSSPSPAHDPPPGPAGRLA